MCNRTGQTHGRQEIASSFVPDPERFETLAKMGSAGAFISLKNEARPELCRMERCEEIHTQARGRAPDVSIFELSAGAKSPRHLEHPVKRRRKVPPTRPALWPRRTA